MIDQEISFFLSVLFEVGCVLLNTIWVTYKGLLYQTKYNWEADFLELSIYNI